MLNCDRSTVKHGTQNIQNYCHQTSGFLTASKCTKYVSGGGPAPDPTGGAYSAPPDHLAGLRVPTFKGEEEEREGKGRDKGERKGTEGTAPPPFANSWIRS